MSSPSPILEKDHSNVTLTCEVEVGNPRFLDEVIWYLDGEILKQLPDCNQTQGEGNNSTGAFLENNRRIDASVSPRGCRKSSQGSQAHKQAHKTQGLPGGCTALTWGTIFE